jgi:hypothetical protein
MPHQGAAGVLRNEGTNERRKLVTFSTVGFQNWNLPRLICLATSRSASCETMQPLSTSTSSVEAPSEARRSLNLFGFSFFIPDSAYDFPCGLPVAYSVSNAASATGCGWERTSLKSISPFEVMPAYPTPPNANISTLERRFRAESIESPASAPIPHRSNGMATHHFDNLGMSIWHKYSAIQPWRHISVVTSPLHIATTVAEMLLPTAADREYLLVYPMPVWPLAPPRVACAPHPRLSAPLLASRESAPAVRDKAPEEEHQEHWLRERTRSRHSDQDGH